MAISKKKIPENMANFVGIFFPTKFLALPIYFIFLCVAK
jgi:hypothetical protein